MFQLELNNEEQEWLLNKYKDLSVTKENGVQVVSGEFNFDASYNDKRLSDTYQIRIELLPSEVSDLPTVFETGSRIKKVSEERKIPLEDLHSYIDGSTCLCVKLTESGYFPDGFSFPVFIEELVVPFFYAQRYFEDQNTWPWEAYSHGLLGWFEWYSDQENHTPENTGAFLEKLKATKAWRSIFRELSKNAGVKGHHPCICGSSRKYRICHNKVFRGLWELQQDIKKFGFNL